MIFLDLLGAALTLLCLGFLGLVGYLAGLCTLREEARRDPLTLAIAALLAATAAGVGIGLLLGALGLLRLELGLAVLATAALALVPPARRRAGEGGLVGPARLLAARAAAHLRARPALALIAVHAVASEALRGLLRPPLSWDSLMYHLWLAATWLQTGEIAPVFAPKPLAFYGYIPANGSVWLWWWLAPSHSELYANLAFLPQLLLLALAAGGVARSLGATRHWPAAAYLAVLAPTVVRFAATQYVDIFLAGAFVAAVHFALRWLARPTATDALLAGAGLGLAAGTKVFGPPYALALAAAVLLAGAGAWRLGGWRPRAAHLLLALVPVVALGAFFYLRNLRAGVGPLALACEGVVELAQIGAAEGEELPVFPRPYSALHLLGRLLSDGSLVDAFLGVTRPESLEMGVGPVAALLLLAALVFPLALGGALRRPALVVQSQVLVHLLLWWTVPYAGHGHLFANLRYLISALALTLAGGIAAAERSRVPDGWLRGLTLAVAIQDLLMLHAQMPRLVRMAASVALLAAAALAVSAPLRAAARARAGALAAAALTLAVLAAPLLATFRVADRGRALAEEFTGHGTPAPLFAGAWTWLDRHAGAATVAVVGSPRTYFIYPAMGPRFERRAVYVNTNRDDRRSAADYPACEPRRELSAEAWLDNLSASGARFLLLSRSPGLPFPPELIWAQQRPDRFRPVYFDGDTVIFEVVSSSR
ncbi:MAG TPA: hypothetical protein VGC93_12490 [Thermoanaerobaculia bacterium]